MKLTLNGETIDLHAPHELITHLGRLRCDPFAELRIEAANGGRMVLFKNGDRALVRYQPDASRSAFRAQSDGDDGETLTFVRSDGRCESVPEAWTIHVMEAYQALACFIRSGGLVESLTWQEAA